MISVETVDSYRIEVSVVVSRQLPFLPLTSADLPRYPTKLIISTSAKSIPHNTTTSVAAHPCSTAPRHGELSGRQAAEADQVPSRVQPKGRREESQHRSDEEVSHAPPSTPPSLRANARRWIAGKISEILGNEDDVVVELCFNLLEGSRYVSRRTRTKTHTQAN